MVFYQKYKNFGRDLFRSKLENDLSNYDINNMKMTFESRVKLLAIQKFSSRLNFDYYVSQLYKKISKKLHALARIFKYVETSKRRAL